jgi:hypothetical protein
MSLSFKDLESTERQLSGAWIETEDGVTPNAVDRRIFWLVTQRLVQRAMAQGGWEQLFVDPRDGRLWELTFPQGSLHGGGPRRLTLITRDAAIEKYGDAAVAEK